MGSVLSSARTMPSAIRELNHHPGRKEWQASEFANKIHWTKEARAWDQAKRAQVLSAVRKFVEGKTFDANQTERKFRIPQVDEGHYSGPSLLALLEVLLAFETFYNRSER